MMPEKFGEAELADSFNGFAEAFDGFGFDQYAETTEWDLKNGPVIGLFYAGFTVLGMTIGALLGRIREHTLADVAVGAGAGLFTGLGSAMISNAIIMLKDRKIAR